ncbi:MAG: DUF6624 domain-containing protein [Mucilaginibacter sp.]
MKNLIIVFLLSMASTAIGQIKLNTPLKKQMDSVFVLDQKYREAMTLLNNPAKKDSIVKVMGVPSEGYQKLQSHIDTLNLIFIEKVFAQYGYPGTTLVGEPTNEAAWNVIQHSAKIAEYLPLIKKAAENKELPFRLYAIMLDRNLLQQDKEQIYGTQIQAQKMKNGKFEMFVWPIKDPETVNDRRKKAGFDLTVEENAKRFNVTYTIKKIDEIK